MPTCGLPSILLAASRVHQFSNCAPRLMISSYPVNLSRARVGRRDQQIPGRQHVARADPCQDAARVTRAQEKVAILGGGMAGLSAAWRLSEPGWRNRFQSITVYQRGWRLGGKGASSRGDHGRIEEHGLTSGSAPTRTPFGCLGSVTPNSTGRQRIQQHRSWPGMRR